MDEEGQHLSLAQIDILQDECFPEIKRRLLLLERAAAEYCDKADRFYNAIILQTMNEEVYKTLESVFKAKTESLKQCLVIAAASQEEQRDLVNIATAVKVFADRQDVLKSELNQLHQEVKATRQDYNARGNDIEEYISWLWRISFRIMGRTRRGDHIRAISFGEDRKSALETSVRTKLRALRKVYNSNQPPKAVLL